MHDDHDRVVGRGDLAILHDQHLFLEETRLDASYGLGDHLAVEALLPYRVIATTIRYLDAADPSQEVQLVDPGIHHRDETLNGPGDLRLVLRFGAELSGWWLEGRAGVTVPLGETQPNPFALGAMGLPHEHIQFGTGTFDPILGLGASRRVGPATLSLWAFSEQILYANGHGYQAGSRYDGGLALESPLGTRAWSFQLSAEALAEAAESWADTAPTDEGNRGRIDLLAGARATVRLSSSLALTASLKVPVATMTEGAQLSYPVVGGLGLVATFGPARAVPPPPPPLPPSTADWSGLDVADATTTGALVPLVAAGGKITLYDFWAPWCPPCREVDARLEEIASRRPDVAVRKVNIVSAATPAAQALAARGFVLPHVTVVGPGGNVLTEAGGTPDDIADAVAGALPARKLAIDVTAAGFSPAQSSLPAGEPVTLVFTRRTGDTCATNVIVTTPAGKITRDLPLDRPVLVPVDAAHPGPVTFACGMDMVKGVLLFSP